MSDSKTFDVKLSGRRDRITVRVKPELKKKLMEFAEKNGLSLCHIFELLVTGYLSGIGEKIHFDVISPTIELSVIREVKRVRRYAKEFFPANYTGDGRQINDFEEHHRHLANWKRSQRRDVHV